jgi:hypothetical protein
MVSKGYSRLLLTMPAREPKPMSLRASRAWEDRRVDVAGGEVV